LSIKHLLEILFSQPNIPTLIHRNRFTIFQLFCTNYIPFAVAVHASARWPIVQIIFSEFSAALFTAFYCGTVPHNKVFCPCVILSVHLITETVFQDGV
jgi:hypothetical protein